MKSLYLIIILVISSSRTVFAQITIKKILADGKSVNDTTKTIHLQANNNNLYIEFEPEYPTPNIRYLYQLKGLENTWTETSYPVVKYMNLSPDDYELLIKTNADTLETNQYKIKIIITKAFWNKWWFYPILIFYVLLVIGIGFYLFFLYDFRQKLKVQYIRNRIASDLHDEVGSNLNSIAIFVELLRKKVEQQNPEILPILEKITNNSIESVGLMRDTVWAINPNNDTLDKLFGRMQNFSTEVLSAKDMALSFENQCINTKTQLSMEQRRNIYLVFKEIINNILKHSEASKVMVNIKNEKNAIIIQVKDNGVGFDTEAVYEGNGLESFKNRSDSDDLTVWLRSEIGKGTEVVLTAYEI